MMRSMNLDGYKEVSMYHIIETQQNKDGTAAILTYQEPTEAGAISKWHAVLQYAVMSEVYIHSCAILTEDLKMLKRESYTHNPQGGDSNGE